MLRSCFCNAREIEEDDAEYVKNGKPMCSQATCDRTRYHMEIGLRRAPHADDIIFDAVAAKEMDSLPNEVSSHGR